MRIVTLCLQIVILSGARASRNEALAESQNPYTLNFIPAAARHSPHECYSLRKELLIDTQPLKGVILRAIGIANAMPCYETRALRNPFYPYAPTNSRSPALIGGK